MSAINYASAEAFRDYVEDFYDPLLTKLHVGFKSAGLFTSHEGVKGKEVLTQLTVAALSKRYSSTFQPLANALAFAPRILEVFNAKVDLKITPKDMEGVYLGSRRKKGQDSMDLPLVGQMLEQIFGKIQSEQEYAIWRAVKTGSPADGDDLAVIFDGIREVIKDEITATTLSPVTTGALTSTNCVASVEAVHASLGDAYQDVTTDIFMNPKDKRKFIQDYRERYGKFDGNTDMVTLDTGDAIFHFTWGVPENCILVTPKENIHHGYDSVMDASFMNFEQEDRNIKMWLDYNIGVNFGLVGTDIIGINNQWTV